MSVHIEKLEREDFYDCVISKDVICAIKFRPDDLEGVFMSLA
jgi:hypothetical protein